MWQPIENAPKDGTDVLVVNTKWLIGVPAYFVSKEYLMREYGSADWMEGGWYPSHKFHFDLPEVVLQPTHWQPLPPPPTT